MYLGVSLSGEWVAADAMIPGISCSGQWVAADAMVPGVSCSGEWVAAMKSIVCSWDIAGCLFETSQHSAHSLLTSYLHVFCQRKPPSLHLSLILLLQATIGVTACVRPS